MFPSAAIMVLLAILLCGPTGAAQAQERVVWAVGDGGDGTPDARALAASIAADEPHALLYLGDVYPNGSAQDFAERFGTVYGGLRGITWPTPGNHDWGNRARGYYPYWGRRLASRPWYRVRLGGWEVISLNSEVRHHRRSPQLLWLRRVLAQSKGTCRLAFWHRPRFSPGTVHGNDPEQALLWNALRRRTRLVANAHDHVMVRYQRRDGITQYISGAGGDTLYGTRPDPRVAFARAGIQGALRMILSRGRASLEFRSITGEVLDRSSARCRPLKAVAPSSLAERRPLPTRAYAGLRHRARGFDPGVGRG
ncbi:MAG: metallophosphoesterase [Thermoleophilaceae bacterium]|nr:metallophosphoesterase [Thermoleophilaceae bacterium]